MRHLLTKDLRILKRSPLLVALLVVYPIALALMIGFALSSPPGKPQVAILNEVDAEDGEFSLGDERVDASQYAAQLYESIDPLFVKTRDEAVRAVESGTALAALIVPEDITQKLASGIEQPQVEVILNVKDPLQQQFVDETIRARLADANQALSEKFTEIAAGYIQLLLEGGSFSIFGQELDVLGLQRAQTILEGTLAQLPEGDPRRAPVEQVISFADLAIENLDLSDDVLKSVGSPVVVKRTELAGKTTPADALAVAIAVVVSLMFVTVLLAAGLVALEREENTFGRLVRGLVSRWTLLTEKIVLSAACAGALTLLMAMGIGIFVSLRWGRFPLWLLAFGFGALAFAALGVAIGALTREVRVASLLSFLLSLPIAFLALIPDNAVSDGLYTVLSTVSALFPFKPSLQAANAALNDTDPSLPLPLLHLALLTAGYAVLARVGLRRF